MEESIRKFRTGTVIFEQGSQGNTLGYLVAGKAGIFLNYGKPGQFALEELGPGEGFGEMSVYNDTTRAVSVIALEDCSVIEITENSLPGFVETHPEFISRLLKTMGRRMLVTTIELMHAHDTIRELIDELGDRTVKRETLRDKLRRYASFFVEVPQDIPAEVYMDYYSRINHL